MARLKRKKVVFSHDDEAALIVFDDEVASAKKKRRASNDGMAPCNVHDKDKSPLAMEKKKGSVTQSNERTGNAALLSLPISEGVPSNESVAADDGDDRDTREEGTTLPEMDESTAAVNMVTEDGKSMAEPLFILDYEGASEEVLEKEDAQRTVLASNKKEGQATNAKLPPQQEASLDQVKERIQDLVASNAPLSLSSLARVYQNHFHEPLEHKKLGFNKIGHLVATMDSIEIELDKISRKKHFLSIIDKSKKVYDCLGCGIPVTGWIEAMEHMKLCCPELIVDCDSSELHRQCVVGNKDRIPRTLGHDKPAISLFCYGCPNCGDIQLSWKRCSEHLQGCCPSLLDNRDFLRPRCMLKRDMCDVPGFKTSMLAKDASLSQYDKEVIRLKRLVATHQPVSLTKVPELYNAMFPGKRLHVRGIGFSSLEDFVKGIPSIKVSKAHPLAERILAIQREPPSHLSSSGKRQRQYHRVSSHPQKPTASSKVVNSAGDLPSLKDVIGNNSSSSARTRVDCTTRNQMGPFVNAKKPATPQDERKMGQSTVIIVESSDDKNEADRRGTHSASEKREATDAVLVGTISSPHCPRKRKERGRQKTAKQSNTLINHRLRDAGQYNFNCSEEDAQREQERLLSEAADRVRATASNQATSQVASDIGELQHDHWKASNMYHRLGLGPEAPIHEVKRRYHRLALAYHPDKGTNYVHTTARFQAVTEAYKVLCEESERL